MSKSIGKILCPGISDVFIATTITREVQGVECLRIEKMLLIVFESDRNG